MQKWEYKTIELQLTRGATSVRAMNLEDGVDMKQRMGFIHLHTYLNQLGLQGWEVVSCSACVALDPRNGGQDMDVTRVLLKRPLHDTPLL